MKSNSFTKCLFRVFAAIALPCVLISSAVSGPVFISATANIYGAGHASPPAPGGLGAGILPTAFALPAATGRVLTFSSVTGTVHYNPSVSNDPDGNGAGSGLSINSYGGLSGITNSSVYGYLVCVFLDDTEPANPAPPQLDFTEGTGMGRTFATISPQLRQVFFVGDGLAGTNSGTQQQFVVPAGATRLFLGFADALVPDGLPGYYFDNSGGVQVEFNISTPAIALSIAAYAGLQLTGLVGSTYRIEYTLDLTNPSWTTLTEIILPSSPYTYFDPLPMNATPKRFYRATKLQ